MIRSRPTRPTIWNFGSPTSVTPVPMRSSTCERSTSTPRPRSIVDGPPTNAFEEFAADVGSTWYPWVGVGAALLLGAVSVLVFRRRATTDRPDMTSTTVRPSVDLTPGLAGGFGSGGPQASVVPATLLDLAARDALDIEPESEGGTFSKPKIQVRLLDRKVLSDDVETALWAELEDRAESGVVSSKELGKLTQKPKPVRDVIAGQMQDRGWLDPTANTKRAPLLVVAIIAIALGILSAAIAGAGGHVAVVFAIVALFVVGIGSIAMFGAFSRMSQIGIEAALPWKAYQQGLEDTAKDEGATMDLDAVLADAIALDVGRHLGDRLESANENGEAIRAFTSQHSGTTGVDVGVFPWWIAFNSVVASSSGGGAVAGGGAGGAAGST